MKDMSDSVKLRFEHGIWCLVFSYLSLISTVLSIVFMVTISDDFFVLLLFSFIAFIILTISTICYFITAIFVSKEEGKR